MSDLLLERKIVWLAALVQLANVLDFMIILPLGPDLTQAINIPSSQMGLVNGIYTFSAAFSAIILARYLDRYDRKKAIVFFLSGLVISTFLTAFAWDTYSMLAFRIIAGGFGGPVTALSLSMVVDQVPIERRGRAIAIVTSAFTVVSVFGIPIGLELAFLFNWQMPFYVIAAFGAVVAVAIIITLPPMTAHIKRNIEKPQIISVVAMLKRKEIRLAVLSFSLASFAAFLLISSTINYFTFNLEYPRGDLDNLYLLGGTVSFIAMMLTGRIVDLYGARLLAFFTAAFYILVVADGFMHFPYLPVILVFTFFMAFSAIMGVIVSTIASETPDSHERAAFMSLQTTFRHFAAGAGGVLSSVILYSDENDVLYNIEYVAAISIICIIALPVIIVILRRELNLKQVQQP